jgi:hypothetical protein
MLLCALAIGVIGMHHTVSAAPEHTPMHSTAHTATQSTVTEDHAGIPAYGADTEHGMSHLCKAILTAMAALLLAWLLLRTGRLVSRSAQPCAAVACFGRDPPRAPQPDLLSSLCVLRL